jgi:hypothetical protein
MPKAEYLKLFTGDSGAMVALFTSDHGWIENVSAQSVFSGDIPLGLPYEEMLLIGDFPLAQFQNTFISEHTELAPEQPTTPVVTVNINGMITNIASDMALSPDQMRDFTRELFKRMKLHLTDGRSIDSPFCSVNAIEKTSSGWTIQFK